MKIFRYRILNHILFWIFIYTFYTLPFILSYGFEINSFVNLIYLPFDILTVYFVISFLIPRYFFKNRQIWILLLGIFLAITINILVSRFIYYVVQPALGFWITRRSLTVDIFYSLLSNFMIVGTAVALKLFSYSHKIQLAQAELEKRSVQSELGILRSQVNPHFLFNVLNNIDSLIFEDREKASNAIFLLSKIMRYMLQESVEERAMLDRELSYIKDYLELASLSFENPDFLEFSISGNSTGKQIPPLLFIPIIENAVKHCNKLVNPPGVKIAFKIEEKFIELTTSNFIKSNDFKLTGNNTGSGLKIVEKRLKLLHGDNYTFKINHNLDKFEIYLKVPLLLN
jgi:two-component system, LytTR family, sensor kinase